MLYGGGVYDRYYDNPALGREWMGLSNHGVCSRFLLWEKMELELSSEYCLALLSLLGKCDTFGQVAYFDHYGHVDYHGSPFLFI